MELIVRNNKGFSLIELMIALFILAFSLLGFLGAMINSIDSNLQNELRNTAIRLASQIAETLLVQDFDNLAANPDCSLTPYDSTNSCLVPDFTHYPNYSVTIRRFQQAYDVDWAITDLNLNLRQIEISINYTYRGQNFTHDTVIYKHRDS